MQQRKQKSPHTSVQGLPAEATALPGLQSTPARKPRPPCSGVLTETSDTHHQRLEARGQAGYNNGNDNGL